MQYFGCTHYPLVKEEINEVLGGNIKFFDGSYRLAVHLKKVLEERNLLNQNKLNNDKLEIEFIDSSNSKEKEERFKKYLKGV